MARFADAVTGGAGSTGLRKKGPAGRYRPVSNTRMIRALRVLLLSIILGVPAWTTALAQQPVPAPAPGPVRIFLDCNFFCDESYLKREITFVDYMRDRKDADVHLLVTGRRLLLLDQRGSIKANH